MCTRDYWHGMTKGLLLRIFVLGWSITAALLLALAPAAWAEPCGDAGAFRRAQEAVNAARQKIDALARAKPPGYYAGQQGLLKKAQDAAQLAKENYQKSVPVRKAATDEWLALSSVTTWLLSADGTAQETSALQKAQALTMPPAISAQFGRAQRLKTDLADLERQIAQAEARLAKADRTQRQDIINYRREQIVPLENSIRSRMPGVPLEQATEKAADPDYIAFKTPELDDLWKQYQDASGQTGQSLMYNAEQANEAKVRGLADKLRAAIEACRQAVQNDLQELETRQLVLRDKEAKLYGGEEGREQITALPANRQQKAEKEREFATLQQELLNQEKAALQKSTAETTKSLNLLKAQRQAENQVTKLEAELKAWQQAQREKSLAEQKLEEQRAVAEVALQDGAAALQRAQTTARQARDAYIAEIEKREEQLVKLRNVRTEWNSIAKIREALLTEARNLKQRRALTEAQRTRILQAWAPHRQRWQQFQAKGLDGNTLIRMEAALPAKKREAQRQLVASLKEARSELEPFNCPEFPDAQKYLATLDRIIQAQENSLNQNSGSGSAGGVGSVAGFMVISDLVLPAADAQNKPQLAKQPATSNRSAASAWKEYTFTVTAGQWHPTGLSLKKDEYFKATATGKIKSSDGFECGPDGGGYWRWWILHGKIGDKLFVIGSGGDERAPQEGQLELGMPRVSGKHFPEDQGFSGAYIVKVSVRR